MSSINSLGSASSFLGALDAARQGITNGVQTYEQAAATVAGASSDGLSANAMVGALAGQIQVTAAARAFEVADQSLGTLLDIRA